MVCANHENKKHKYILQWIIIIVKTFLLAQFHSTASYFMQDGLFDTSISLELMPNTKQRFAQCPRNRLFYCHSTCLRCYWVPFCMLVVREQLHGIPKHSMQAVHLLARVVSFQITKPWNVELSKNFHGYPGPRKHF